MQYILSQEEFDELSAKQEIAFNLTKKQLQTLCTKIANDMPIKWPWGPGKDTPTPWRCILTRESDWYCDNCPVKAICPNEDMEFSK